MNLDLASPLILMIGSLGFSAWEIQISTRALDIDLEDLEEFRRKREEKTD